MFSSKIVLSFCLRVQHVGSFFLSSHLSCSEYAVEHTGRRASSFTLRPLWLCMPPLNCLKAAKQHWHCTIKTFTLKYFWSYFMTNPSCPIWRTVSPCKGKLEEKYGRINPHFLPLPLRAMILSSRTVTQQKIGKFQIPVWKIWEKTQVSLGSL